ncbi:MAG: PAS domain-containing protein [Phycisphaerae bacterium]|nr:PAS domain-containing protein [Phycisphaerae bacterium]
MKKRSLLWQLYPSYLLIILITAVAIGWYASQSMHHLYYNQVSDDLQASSDIIKGQVADAYIADEIQLLADLCQKIDKTVDRRITVIASDGQVKADSREDPDIMDNHSDRDEIIEAFNGNVATRTRYSHTLGKNMMYVAMPLIVEDSKVTAVLRISKSVNAINSELDNVYYKIFIGGAIIAGIAAILSLLVSKKISRPLCDLQAAANNFADGRLDYKLPLTNCYEIAAVSDAMIQMACDLNEKIQTISRERNEHRTVLSSMQEAVLAIDNDHRIMILNKAAAKMIEADIDKVKGKTLQEVTRNPALQDFMLASLESVTPLKENIVIHKNDLQFFLQAHSNTLENAQGNKIGVLVVFNDITQTQKLQQIRQDFVANVSHELKTPITSIKGFVETLISSQESFSEDTARFLNIIARQSDRMDAIVDDLLMLSKLEQQSKNHAIELQPESIKKAIDGAIELCHTKADQKQIEIHVDCPENIVACINEPLLEQALVNLIDNAVKYSWPSGKIQVNASKCPDCVSIDVIDDGCGIESQYLPRLFERFYRVDKARSRKAGGTGLGLAIVKHIIQALKGEIEVQSTPNKGSKFSIKLPM